MTDFYAVSVQPALDSRWRLEPGHRLNAILTVYERKRELIDSLPPVFIIAPTKKYFGCSTRFDSVSGPVVYLSPVLEIEQQDRINYIVAHELAHVALGHYRDGKRDMTIPHDDRPTEIAADSLAREWGFEPATGNTEFLKMLDAHRAAA